MKDRVYTYKLYRTLLQKCLRENGFIFCETHNSGSEYWYIGNPKERIQVRISNHKAPTSKISTLEIIVSERTPQYFMLFINGTPMVCTNIKDVKKHIEIMAMWLDLHSPINYNPQRTEESKLNSYINDEVKKQANAEAQRLAKVKANEKIEVYRTEVTKLNNTVTNKNKQLNQIGELCKEQANEIERLKAQLEKLMNK